MITQRLSPKHPLGRDIVTFDFTDDLGPTASIASFSQVSIAVDRGTDGTPATVLNGASPQAGKLVYQPVKSGVANCDYLLIAVVVTNEATPRTLVLAAILPVRDA